jgi:hypothetical protein
MDPAFLVGGTVRVEINGLAVGEADTETFLDELVPFIFFCEG